MAPKEQVEIPFIVWDSDEGMEVKDLEKVGQYHVFHSLMKFMGLESPIFDEEKNIFK
jgi:lipid A ethanolaminephosphotransferase